jgi:dTDP-4-dehydrorhamnose 3,5-epimerase-like enzyme
MIGAGTVVTKSVPAFATVYGNPGRIHGYIEKLDVTLRKESTETETKIQDQNLPGKCIIIQLNSSSDVRGNLTAVDFTKFDFFSVQRTFFVYDVPGNKVRGEHAHRKCSQFLIALSGSIKVIVDDGVSKEEVLLDSPIEGLLIPPMVWATQYDFTKGAVLAVLASDPYDSNDYIRDYKTFSLELNQ